MAIEVERMVAVLEARFDKYEKSLAKARGDTDKQFTAIERRGKQMESVFAGLGRNLFGMAAGIVTVERAASVISGAVSEFAKIGDAATRIGMTTDALQALRFEAAQNGAEADNANGALQRFSRNLGDAQMGSGELLKLLQANNVSLKDQSGNFRDTNTMLEEFARLVAGAATQQQQLQLVTQAMGREDGPRFLETLLKIAEQGLPAIVVAAKEVGVIADKELIAKAKEIDDAWDKMTTQVGVYVRSRIIEAMREWQILASALSGKAMVEAGQPPATFAQRFDALNNGGRSAPPPAPGSTRIPPPTGAGGDSKDPFERQIDSINKHITALIADTATIGQNKAAHETLRVEMALLEAARRGDTKVTDEQIALYAQLRATMTSEQALRAAGITLHEADAAAFEKISQRMRMVSEEAERLKNRFEGMTDALKFSGNQLVDVIDKMSQKGANFGEIMRAVLRDVTKEMLRAAIVGEGAFAKLFGLGGVGGGAGGLFGLIGGLFGGARATGGPVSGGRAYMVGERGPEIMVPRTGGTVLPNQAVGGTTVVQHVTIDNRGADQAAVARLERSLDQLQRTLPQQVAAINRQQRVRHVRP